ncbi:hypothetical protein [Actinotalea sp. JY-7876]|uniref:hypothetical protein n=1 Tax=Actinotalea sp. JY-7876 TaxID=2758442 RepID=UPI0015F5012C|nr:hypothetical protein [Actinotalea sp. JY-7876]
MTDAHLATASVAPEEMTDVIVADERRPSLEGTRGWMARMLCAEPLRRLRGSGISAAIRGAAR